MDKYNQLIEQGAEAYLNALDEAGWFKDTEAKDKIRKKLIKEKDPKYYALVLADVAVDAEGFEDEASYQGLLKEFIKVIGVTDWEHTVRYKNDNTIIHITIKTPKSTYTYDIDPEETFGWLDATFAEDFINDEVLEGEGIESRFFDIPAADQSALYVYVPEKVHNKALKKGIIPDEPEYFLDFGEE